jgi:hypothetical protein
MVLYKFQSKFNVNPLLKKGLSDRHEQFNLTVHEN